MIENEQKKVNKGILIGWTTIALVLLAAYFVEYLKGARSFLYFFVFAVFDLIPLVITLIVYHKNKNYANIKIICAVSYTAFYAFALLTSTTDMVFVYALPMLCVFIICNNSRLIGLFGCGAFVTNIIYFVLKAIKGNLNANISSYEVQIAAIVLCTVFAYISTRISTDLYNGRIAALKRNEERKIETLRKVIEVEEAVKGNTTDITAKLDDLMNSFSLTMIAMEETVAGSSNTTEAVQKQLTLTDDIQKIFNEANNLGKSMIQIVEKTVNTVTTGENNMKILEDSAKQVELSSNNVVYQMDELQDTANQVRDIVGIISGIANKTNLLALNASIEAARAGESGRGFSVVATEITNLAKQTKIATDDITSIITSLHDRADESRKIAFVMADLNKNQNHYIYQTNTNFIEITTSVEALKNSIEKLNSQMKDLLTAMHCNIDSISTISAISEEVVASANQTYDNTSANAVVVNLVSGLAKELIASVNQLERFVME